jgi:hypothetical protein
VVLLAVAVIVLNVLDSITTYIGLYRMPPGLGGVEGNPLMAWLGSRKFSVATAIKQSVGVGIAVAGFLTQAEFGLIVVVILYSLIVMNNTYILVRRAITRKPCRSPLVIVTDLLHIPEALRFPSILCLLLLVSGFLAARIT